MEASLKSLCGYSISTGEGILGRVEEFYFDDQSWVVRYLGVALNQATQSKKILIATLIAGEPDGMLKRIPVSLSKDQLDSSPSIDTTNSFSGQQEQELLCSWPVYWGEGFYPGSFESPFFSSMDKELNRVEENQRQKENPHLRSLSQVMDYYVHALDGDIGHLEDFIVLSEGWKIKSLVINTRNWLPSKRVLISAERIREIDEADFRVVVNLNREAIKKSPVYS